MEDVLAQVIPLHFADEGLLGPLLVLEIEQTHALANRLCDFELADGQPAQTRASHAAWV